MRKKIIFAVVGIALFAALVFAATHSVIAVNLPGANTGGYTYEIISSDGSSTTYKTDKPTAKKIVRKGNYTVIVKQDGSYFKSVNTKPFLQTSEITASTQAEAQRTFVGQEPGRCMFYLGGRLLSNNCKEAYDTNEHVPANASLPTYTQPVPGSTVYGDFKGVATTKSGANIMLTQTLEGKTAYYIQQVQSNLSAGQLYKVPALDPTDEYKIKPFRDGVVLYNTDYSEFFYYQDIAAAPTKLNLDQPDNNDYLPFSISVANDTITMVYSGLDPESFGAEGEPDGARPVGGGSNVLVYRDDTQQANYQFDKNTFLTATACGTSKLCAADEPGLKVYDISGKKPKLLYEIPNVEVLEYVGSKLLALTTNQILTLNPDDASGYIDYTFGDYSYCGIETAGNNYLICVYDDKGNKSALLMDGNIKDSDAIDKKVLSLRRSKGVSGVSPYDHYIYIAPDYGESIYNPNTQGYMPDPAKAKIANLAIKDAITKSGIDTSKYTIINTGD